MVEVSENIFGIRARTSQKIHWMYIAWAAGLIQDREIIAVCIQDHTALISALCGQMREQVANTLRGSPQNGRGPTAVVYGGGSRRVDMSPELLSFPLAYVFCVRFFDFFLCKKFSL